MINKQERFDEITQIKKELISRSSSLTTRFAIITTGSVEYGFNEFHHGYLDDVDTIFIVPDEISRSELKDIYNILDKKELPQDLMIDDFISDKFETLRVEGMIKNIKISCHTLKLKSFVKVTHEKNFKLRNLMPYKEKSINVPFSENVLGFPIFISPKKKFEYYNEEKTYMLLYEYGFRSIPECEDKCIEYKKYSNDNLYVDMVEIENRKEIYTRYPKLEELLNSKITVVKAIINDKILKGSIAFNSIGDIIVQSIATLWEIFLTESFKQNPDATLQDILHSCTRSHRYSEEYVQKFFNHIQSFNDKSNGK